MRFFKLILLSTTVLLFLTCKNDKKENNSAKKEFTINLNPKSDSKVEGTVAFSEKEGVVHLEANIKGLSKGAHAIHIHDKADCSSPDGKSTGGHWNPTAQPHGKWGNSTGYHKGDIGNFIVRNDGLGKVIFSTNEWCIGCDDESKNILGKAIIVHKGTDDYVSQPSGAAGARVSCAGIIQ